jgi:ABC-type lipoprotein export system ATPase subunit
MIVPDPGKGNVMLLQLDTVSKSYDGPAGPASTPVLAGISLAIDAGDAVAVVGPSGSGKSTLLNIMGGLDRPSSGAVRLGGTDLAALGDNELAARRNSDLGFVFQQHHLLPQCTVLENALLPTIPARRAGGAADAEERAQRLLERVGLSGRLDHRPGQLSGGECQRVAVVRALINQPRLLLADEPTGSLDSATAHDLGQLLIDLNQEEATALVVVTHAAELARRLPITYRLQGGRLEVLGTGESTP